MSESGPGIDVVIVNWNAGRQLAECLESLASLAGRHCHLASVTVVDNASSDGSADAIDADGLPLRVLRNDVNRGFGAACNQAARNGSGEYVLFLNPDTRVGPETLDIAIDAIESRDRVGIAGVQLHDGSGTVAKTCAQFPVPSSMVVRALGLDRGGWLRSYMMTSWAHDETRMVDHVIGAFYLVRRTVFEQLSGFDERFFVYLEDLDFSYRAWRAGWRTLFVADAQTYHRGGGTSHAVPATRLAYAIRSRLAYADKHFGPAGRLAVRAATFLGEPLIRCGHAVLRGSPADLVAVFGAYRLLWSGPHR
jgi:GT2 family glycosyltransferase